ncbi:hypothetical protein I6G97_09910 [Edwardsiella hoshinae]|uniref:hypothetical protein n=1 Tax=Edwardsiella hoshinae TaxID=93378 RepID=UPI0004662AFF|nr:hypothetical protein [Edwardsiella hoshinae]QPR26795.1 hypothetical protein I6G97_09910 [Edwardsiella hoshinae]
MCKKYRLTDAQVYTLRRMRIGTRFFMQHDARRGQEERGNSRINCPSLPVLFRLGLVDFCSDCLKQKGTWYRVRLTSDGIAASGLAQLKKEQRQSAGASKGE